MEPVALHELLLQGQDAMRRGDWPSALAAISDVTAADPANLAAQIDLAQILRKTGRASEAETIYRKILELTPDFVLARLGLGTLLRERGELDASRSEIERALAFAPNDVTAQLQLAQTLRDIRDFAEAERVYRAVLAVEPYQVVALLGLGQVAWDCGDRGAALAIYKEAAGIDPNDHLTNVRVAEALLAARDLESAAPLFQRISAAEPENLRARTGLGRIAFQRRNFETARGHFEAVVAARPRDVNACLDLAWTLQELMQATEAEALYRRVLDLSPDNRHASLGLGVALRLQGRAGEALQAIDAVIGATSGSASHDVEALLERAYVRHQLGDFDGAGTDYRAILAQQPRHVAALHGLGQNEWDRGQHEAALAFFQAAAEIDVGNSSRALLVAGMLFEEKRFEDAAVFFGYALVAEPQNSVAHVGLARVAVQRGAFAEAYDHFMAAAKSDPANVSVALELAWTARELAHPAEAEAIYRDILTRTPDCMPAHFGLGALLRSRGELDEALAELSAAIDAAPSSSEAQIPIPLELAWTLQELKRPLEAEAIYNRILADAPNCLPALLGLGALLRQRGARDAAVAAFDAALVAAPASVDAHIEKAQTLRELLDFTAAEANYRAALTQQPNNVTALIGLGQILAWDRGHWNEALPYFETAIAVRPDDPTLAIQAASLLIEQWRIAEAETLLRRVIAQDPNNVAAMAELGKALTRSGDEEQAIEQFRAALALEPNNQGVLAELRRLQPLYGQQWREEISDAIAVLKDALSATADRLAAADLLLQYGITDVLPEALKTLTPTSAIARRILKAAHELDRQKLSQSAIGFDRVADPEQAELNEIRGYIERLTPGAETLVLVFCGRLHRIALSLDIMHRILRRTGASLIYMRDLEGTCFAGGVVGLGHDFDATVQAFRRLMARSGARRLLVIGHCVGCAGALRYGLQLGAEAVLAIGPSIGSETYSAMSRGAVQRLRAMRAATPQLAIRIPALYRAAEAVPRVTLLAGDSVGPDISFARDMAAQVPSAIVVPIEGGDHDCLLELLARGVLTRFLSEFVESGAIDPETQARIRQPETVRAKR